MMAYRSRLLPPRRVVQRQLEPRLQPGHRQRLLSCSTSGRPPIGNNIELFHAKLRTLSHNISCGRSYCCTSSRSYVPHHDIGGDKSAFGPIPGAKVKDLLAWERQCHSVFVVLATKKVVGTDELRRAIEALTPEQYEKYSYYEKWTAAMVTLLLEYRVIKHSELQASLFGSLSYKRHQQCEIAMFSTGDSVRVKKFLSNIEWRRPHIRTPGYIYGVAGRIERVCGHHGDPSFLAFGLEAPRVQLYRVRFHQRDIWPEQFDTVTNDEAIDDLVEVEVYEHWLEHADESSGHDFENETLFDHKSGDDCIADYNGHSHAHHHHHHHGKDEMHVHEPRPLVESRAVEKEGPPTPGKELFQALYHVLLVKGIMTADDVRLVSEKLDTAAARLDGADLVVRAWMDPDFEERLLINAAAAAFEMGIHASNPNAPTVLTVLKNTPSTHNVIVCTLCSCYPSALLGIAPAWYKSREYRSRTVREPRRVLEEFGVTLSNNTTIRVHDSTADHRYLVLPLRPEGTDNWTKEELRALVTRDTMLGVAVPPPAGSK